MTEFDQEFLDLVPLDEKLEPVFHRALFRQVNDSDGTDLDCDCTKCVWFRMKLDMWRKWVSR